ncbi:MAG: UDP-3-O-acyl-N-acetylglucosamine deacetylase [Pseudomonadota bacterium]|nr:UDP-3-O-acyl-N-acetylglucosamine deacetylase [Pseudomonadota bacterium]
MQKTFGEIFEIEGIGLHSGLASKMIFHPAEADTGIVFVRADLPDKPVLQAVYNQVVDTRNCTCLGNANQEIVSTIEHIMATLSVLGVDNARIEVTNPETPIMDGSAKVFYERLKQVPLRELPAKRKYLKVLRKVTFADGKGAQIALYPAENFHIRFAIDFPSKIIGHQEFDAAINEEIFERQIVPARTFCEKYQVDYLRSVGLIKGGSLENAVVLDGEKILNEGGFRVENEAVSHKVLDCIGDMYTSGYPLLARVEAEKTGHFHNNEVLKVLFSDSDNYQLVEE